MGQAQAEVDEAALQQRLNTIKKSANKATAHAGMARTLYNTKHQDWDEVDQAEALAALATAEALSAGLQLLLFIIEEGR